MNAVAPCCEQNPAGASDQWRAYQKVLEPASYYSLKFALGGKLPDIRRADGETQVNVTYAAYVKSGVNG